MTHLSMAILRFTTMAIPRLKDQDRLEFLDGTIIQSARGQRDDIELVIIGYSMIV
jgi:hypothetical protein